MSGKDRELLFHYAQGAGGTDRPVPRFPGITVRLTSNGSIFAVAGQVGAALRNHGHGDLVSEFIGEVVAAASYVEALNTASAWVSVS